MTNIAPRTKKFRTVFLGTPEVSRSVLEALASSEHYDVVGVVTQPDRPAGRKMQLQPSPVKVFANQKNIKVISPEKMTPEVIEEIKSWKPEVAVVIAFGQILPQSFLDIMPENVVNLHTSLLPRWRGAAPVQRAIMAGDKTTGMCLQVMVKKLDAGDIIASEPCDIDDEINSVELLWKLCGEGSRMLEDQLVKYLNRQTVPYPIAVQDESQVTYAHKIDKAESKIDWQLPARDVHNKVRGMVMGPGTYAMHGDKKIKIHKTVIADETKPGRPGYIVSADDKGIEVECATGRLLILEIQPESRPKMKVREYLAGHALKAGDTLG